MHLHNRIDVPMAYRFGFTAPDAFTVPATMAVINPFERRQVH